HVASLVCAWRQVTVFYAKSRWLDSGRAGFEGAWHRATLERGSTSHPERRTGDMSKCYICHVDDVVAQRSSRGTDAQQRVVVHQQCPRSHRWHLAFEIADKPLGDRDILICDCPVERVSLCGVRGGEESRWRIPSRVGRYSGESYARATHRCSQ